MAETLQEAKKLHRRTTWAPETTILKAEDTEDRQEWSKCRIEIRVAHCFSFWLGEKCVGFGPEIASSKDLKNITMRAMVASLNGDASYLAQAGEFELEWPLRHYEHMKITDFCDVRIDSHKSFRNGQPAVCVTTATHQYFLLQPDIFYEKKHWEANARAWEDSQSRKLTLTFEDISHKSPRPAWWKCEDSWHAWVLWSKSENGEDPEPDLKRDEPRLDDHGGGPQEVPQDQRPRRSGRGKQTAERDETDKPQSREVAGLRAKSDVDGPAAEQAESRGARDRKTGKAQEKVGTSRLLGASNLGKRPISAVADVNEAATPARRAKIDSATPGPHPPRTRRPRTPADPISSTSLSNWSLGSNLSSALNPTKLVTGPTLPTISRPVSPAPPSPLDLIVSSPSTRPTRGENSAVDDLMHETDEDPSCELQPEPQFPLQETARSAQDTESQVVAVVSLLSMRSEVAPFFLPGSLAESLGQQSFWDPLPQYVAQDGLVPPYTQSRYIEQNVEELDYGNILRDLDEIIASQAAGGSGIATVTAPYETPIEQLGFITFGYAPDDIIVAEN